MAKLSDADLVTIELHRRLLFLYVDKTEAGDEPTREWMLTHLEFVITGDTAADRITTAKKLIEQLLCLLLFLLR
jgi:hypothetical protein